MGTIVRLLVLAIVSLAEKVTANFLGVSVLWGSALRGVAFAAVPRRAEPGDGARPIPGVPKAIWSDWGKQPGKERLGECPNKVRVGEETFLPRVAEGELLSRGVRAELPGVI